MIITKPEQLKDYYESKRLWQGIPSVEVTKKGRIFVTFYSGGVTEWLGNYSLVIMSDDGVNYSEPVVVAISEGKRCYDPCLWIDPLGRLWFTWGQSPDDGLYASICENPDADELVWSEEFLVGHNVMMNKPIVLTTGEWVFPISVWRDGVRLLPKEMEYTEEPRGARMYSSVDQGKTFQLVGTSFVEPRSFDEHQIVEMKDGSLNMYVRVSKGMKLSKSYDRGKHWSEGLDCGIKSPGSRFHIRRLPSGRLLMINHFDYTERNNMTALLSDDEGKTWPYKLLLDERNHVSYPDVAIGPDGDLFVTYDRERGAWLENLEQLGMCAKEIMMARITEQDILDGCVNSKNGYLKRVISKLNLEEYDGADKNPYNEVELLSDSEYAKKLINENKKENVLKVLFDKYWKNFESMQIASAKRIDDLIEKFQKTDDMDKEILKEIISVMRTEVVKQIPEENALVERIVEYIDRHLMVTINIEEVAEHFEISMHYMCHMFKKKTGTNILELQMERRNYRHQIKGN